MSKVRQNMSDIINLEINGHKEYSLITQKRFLKTEKQNIKKINI